MGEAPLRRQDMAKWIRNIPDIGSHGKSGGHHLSWLGKLFFKEIRLEFGRAGLCNMHQMFGET